MVIHWHVIQYNGTIKSQTHLFLNVVKSEDFSKSFDIEKKEKIPHCTNDVSLAAIVHIVLNNYSVKPPVI